MHQYQSVGDPDGTPGMDWIKGVPLNELPRRVFERREGENEFSFGSRLSDIVHNSTYHCYPDDFELSFLEQQIEAFFVWSRQTEFGWREGLLGDRMLCGFCHQRAFLLVTKLREAGIEATTYGLSGHVVALAVLDGIEFLLDPDYGTEPINYRLDGTALRAEVFDAYKHSAWNNAIQVYPMIASRDDNGPYNPGYIEIYAKNQTALMRMADRAATVMIVLASTMLLFLTVSTLLLIRRRRGNGLAIPLFSS